MNELGWMILGAALRATALALVGLLVVFVVKRRGPTAAALAGSATLLVMVGVTALAVSPWPRWWSPDLAEPVAPTPVAARPSTEMVASAEPVIEPAPLPKAEPAATPTWSDFVREYRRELAKPASTGPRTTWRWPAWLACLFLGGLAWALFRLGLGLWAVRSLRSRSRAIDDPSLIETFTMLRGELGLDQPIELRESTEMATPALIGWRRPAVILPESWSEWDEPERRAVLAHELAHIYRGDYLIGLFAQISLSLHFYHPLAHALARRLRLQQELAADALGAALAGGRRPYLTALANLALRQEPRPAAWPARPFLPTQGTFLRRIEMLRDPKALQHPPMRRASRALTVATLALVGLLIAGFRGPSGSTLAQAPLSLKPILPILQGQPPLDPSTASSDAILAIDIRPGELLKDPEIKKLAAQIQATRADDAAISLLLSGEIEQMVVLGFAKKPDGNSTKLDDNIRTIFVLRSVKPIDWKKLFLNQFDVEVKSDGFSYFRSSKHPMANWYRVLDPLTFLIGDEPDVKLPPLGVARPKGRHGWDDAWSKLAPSPVRVAVETSWLAKQLQPPLAQGRPGPTSPMMGIFDPLLDKAQAYAVALNINDGLIFDGFATCANEEGSQRVAETLRACLTLGRNMIPDSRRSARSEPPPQARASSDLLDAFDAMLASAKVEQDKSVAKYNAAEKG